jgi:hypothetical protein
MIFLSGSTALTISPPSKRWGAKAKPPVHAMIFPAALL